MIRVRNQDGFLMIELLVAMSVMLIALSALIVVFTTGLLAARRSSQVTTAAMLADSQMEAYHAMTARDIGIDKSAGVINTLDSTYKNDAACVNGATTCAGAGVSATETGPTGAVPDTCTNINSWYSGTLPCTPSRTVSTATTPASPDGRTYRVDTYIVQLAAVTSGGTLQRTRKQVTVVVRDSLLNPLARETEVFDCSTGAVPNSTDC